MSQEKKNKIITEAIRVIHKQFGSGSIMRLDGAEVQEVRAAPPAGVRGPRPGGAWGRAPDVTADRRPERGSTT